MSWRGDFVHDGGVLRVTLDHLGGDRFQVVVGDRTHVVTAHSQPNGLVAMRLGDRVLPVAVAACGERLQVRVDGRTWTLERARARREPTGSGVVVAPMAGTVLRIAVEVGQQVDAGETVAVLSAMKMEHRLSAGVSGEVAEVVAADGQIVDQGAVLVRIASA